MAALCPFPLQPIYGSHVLPFSSHTLTSATLAFLPFLKRATPALPSAFVVLALNAAGHSFTSSSPLLECHLIREAFSYS